MLTKNGFATTDLRPSTLVLALRDEKKDHVIALRNRTRLILELVNKSFYFFLNNKSVAKM